MKKLIVVLGTLIMVFVGAKMASAGPIIIDGTDANDHGSATGTANQDGWLYMQQAMEHLQDQVYTGTAKVVVDLGTTDVITTLPTCSGRGHNARMAIDSAFNLSALPSKGWTLLHEDGVLSITDWLNNLSPSNTGILYIPTYNNLCGDLAPEELAVINAHSTDIANFINGPGGDAAKGGALFAMSERNESAGPASVGAYLWLESAIPGISAAGFSGDISTPISLTLDGMTAFPGLTNANLSTGPWHNWFVGNFGSLRSLAMAQNLSGITQTVILGGGTGATLGPQLLSVSKAASVLNANGHSAAPGDTIAYTVTIANLSSTKTFTQVTYSDTPDINTSIVAGSVATTQGTVTSGNTAGDSTIGVNVGDIAPSATVTITYRVTVHNPLPPQVTNITNQGVVSATGGPFPTCAPSVSPACVPTIIPIVPPVIPPFTAQKRGTSLNDPNHNGSVLPGGVLSYVVQITNTSGAIQTHVLYSDTLDPNTNLVVGSVTTTLGSVTSGNTPGDTAVHVSIGTMLAGETVAISYEATVTNPIPAGVTVIRNQGIVSSDTVTGTPTCDPADPTGCNPTPVPIAITPTLQLSVVSDVPLCTLPGATYHLTWTVTNIGSSNFGGAVLNTVATGSGSVPPTTTVPALPGNTSEIITQTVVVSEPVAYGSETVTVTGSILTATAQLATHICAPDFRTSTAVATSIPVFAHEELTYTWIIRNTGDSPALGTSAVLTLSTNPQFAFDDSLTFTSGLAAWNPVTNTVLWTGDIAVGQTVTVTFHAQSLFGLPHGIIEAPFQIDHPYRPPFAGNASYTYPYKLFFMLVLKNAP